MGFSDPTLLNAVGASVIAGGVATGLGALAIVPIGVSSPRTRAALSGFGAGVMLSASVFSLLLPALEQRKGPIGALVIAASFLFGAAAINVLNRVVPHEHFLKGPEGTSPHALRRVWLFVLAITLHNFPEGLAVGVGVGSGDTKIAIPIIGGIAMQNAPEGFVVSASLVQERYSRRTAVLVGLLTGLVEPISAGFGFGALRLATAMLPLALSFAAGAMIYVVSSEIIPESHRSEHASFATRGTILGFALMMVLDVALGGG